MHKSGIPEATLGFQWGNESKRPSPRKAGPLKIATVQIIVLNHWTLCSVRHLMSIGKYEIFTLGCIIVLECFGGKKVVNKIPMESQGPQWK